VTGCAGKDAGGRNLKTGWNALLEFVVAGAGASGAGRFFPAAFLQACPVAISSRHVA
jgi:hypothetical protein